MPDVLAIALASLAFIVVVQALFYWRLSQAFQRHKIQLAERETLRDQRLRELSKRLDTYLTGCIGMGEELQELRRVVAPLPDKVQQIEQRDPNALSFTQAAKLVGMGASVDDLTQSCGLSRAEAELVAKLNKARS